jgi:hypothetical protein
MRTAGLGLALLATVQMVGLTLLSSPAFAEDPTSAAGSASASVSLSTSSTSADGSASTTGNPDKARTGWILVGVGGALAIGGIVVDIVGANSGTVAGAGGGSDNGQTNNTRTDLYFVGTTLLVVGIVTGIYGGSMVWSANHPDSKASAKPEDDAKIDGVSKAAQAAFAAAPAFTVPVIGAVF